MPADEAPDDDDTRHTYNFAPGSYGLVYRADVPDHGAGEHRSENQEGEEQEPSEGDATDKSQTKEQHYKLQAMKWGAKLDTGKTKTMNLMRYRTYTILDQAKSRLRLDDEDHQLPR